MDFRCRRNSAKTERSWEGRVVTFGERQGSRARRVNRSGRVRTVSGGALSSVFFVAPKPPIAPNLCFRPYTRDALDRCLPTLARSRKRCPVCGLADVFYCACSIHLGNVDEEVHLRRAGRRGRVLYVNLTHALKAADIPVEGARKCEIDGCPHISHLFLDSHGFAWNQGFPRGCCTILIEHFARIGRHKADCTLSSKRRMRPS